MISRWSPTRSSFPWLLSIALVGCLAGDDYGDNRGDGGMQSDAMIEYGECVEGCDPLEQLCSAGQRCLPDGNTFVCQGMPAESVPLALHEGCDVAGQACDIGLMCLQVAVPGCSGGTGCCIAFCDLAHPQCSSGLECTAYFGEDAACYEEVGACVP